jgi:two-component system sensor histidine kinase PilS (NtrC family)
VQPENLIVRFDPTHLHQVLWNLCSNACIHGTPSGQIPKINLTAGLSFSPETAFIEVQDFGPGISNTETKKIFEPFFTTKTQGTGLGLYIAREICEANGAQLQYTRPPEGGSCFRITLAKSAYQEEESQWKLAMH